jgi:hypothetical protein
MTPRHANAEKWAKIPESLIVGELLPGISSQRQSSALRLFCYLDLRQGTAGWAPRGFRSVAKVLGLQERTVAEAAKALAEAGIIELTLTKPNATSAVMKVIHNPARGNTNPAVTLGPAPKRDRHGTLSYPSQSYVRDLLVPVRVSPVEAPTPDARNATGSRSARSKWFDDDTRDALASLASDHPRCSVCLGLTEPVHGREVGTNEHCDCPFVSEAG